MSTITIRPETPADYRAVEVLTREAFWNQYVLGCDEHYFVHCMRDHPDFLPELALVLELDGEIIGNIMYTKSRLTADDGSEKETLTFGPVSIHPAHQRRGYGKMLIEASFELALSLGYDTVVIFGNPGNYVSRGFVSGKRRNVCVSTVTPDGTQGVRFPTALLVKELLPGALDAESERSEKSGTGGQSGKLWYFQESTAGECCADTEAVAAFDRSFPAKEKHWQASQEEFYIYSHSSVTR